MLILWWILYKNWKKGQNVVSRVKHNSRALVVTFIVSLINFCLGPWTSKNLVLSAVFGHCRVYWRNLYSANLIRCWGTCAFSFFFCLYEENNVWEWKMHVKIPFRCWEKWKNTQKTVLISGFGHRFHRPTFKVVEYSPSSFSPNLKYWSKFNKPLLPLNFGRSPKVWVKTFLVFIFWKTTDELQTFPNSLTRCLEEKLNYSIVWKEKVP